MSLTVIHLCTNLSPPHVTPRKEKEKENRFRNDSIQAKKESDVVFFPHKCQELQHVYVMFTKGQWVLGVASKIVVYRDGWFSKGKGSEVDAVGYNTVERSECYYSWMDGSQYERKKIKVYSICMYVCVYSTEDV